MRVVHESRHEAGVRLPVHRHQVAYAAFVLAGSYRETGPDGEWRCEEGVLVMHPPFHLHGDDFAHSGARVLNLELSLADARRLGLDRYAVLQPGDPDAFLRTAARDPLGALGAAIEDAVPASPQPGRDWLGLLVERVRAEPHRRISALASEAGVSPARASRAFTRRFGLGPARFRSEHRVRRALQELADPTRTLCDIAQDCGYADQAHLTRAVHATTGSPPGRLRRVLA